MLSEERMDHVDPAQISGLDHFLKQQTAGLKIFAIGGHEQNVIVVASVDHVASLSNGGRQWLFTEHVLAGSCRSNHIFLVFYRRSRDVDRIDAGIVEAAVKLVVAVSVAGTKVLCEPIGLLLVTTHDR